MRLTKSARSKKPAGSKKPAAQKQSNRFAEAAGTVTLVMVVGFVAVAMLIAREPSSVTPPAASADAPASEAVVSKASAAPARTRAPETNMTITVRPPADAKNASPVTIAGCLERDGDGFRLTKTSGADAPKARSWKSGFMRKGTAAVEVVDASGGLRLASHLERRVSVTGMLDDRELRARSLRTIASSCN